MLLPQHVSHTQGVSVQISRGESIKDHTQGVPVQTSRGESVKDRERSDKRVTFSNPISQIKMIESVVLSDGGNEIGKQKPYKHPNKATLPDTVLHSTDKILRQASAVEKEMLNLVTYTSGGKQSVQTTTALHLLIDRAFAHLSSIVQAIMKIKAHVRDPSPQSDPYNLASFIGGDVIHETDVQSREIMWISHTQKSFRRSKITLSPSLSTKMYRSALEFCLGQVRLHGNAIQLCLTASTREVLYMVRETYKPVQNLLITLVIRDLTQDGRPAYGAATTERLLASPEKFMALNPLDRYPSNDGGAGFRFHQYFLTVSARNVADLLKALHLTLNAAYREWPALKVSIRKGKESTSII